MSDDVRQIFVRNEKGKTWGPLTVGTIELLVDNGLIDGKKLQVSEDGLRYMDPGKFPHLRAAFPKEMWGETVPGPTVELAVAPVPVIQSDGSAAPQNVGAQTNSAVPGPPPAAVRAGPGSAPGAVRAGPGAGGPGARAAPSGPAAAPSAGPGAAPSAGPAAAPSAGPGAVRAGPGAGPTAGPGAVRAGPGANRPAPPRVGPPVMTPGPMPAVGAPGNPPVMTPGPIPAVGAAPARPLSPPTPAAGNAPIAPAPPIEMSPEGSPPPSSGELSRQSPVHLYYLAASGDHTGLLTFTLADRTIGVHFRKGNPEHVTSSHAEDSVPGFLLRTNQASAEQIGKAEAEKDKFGGELIPALFGLGILNPGTAFAQLAQHATNTLMKALIAEAGTFTWEQKDLPPQKAMPLGNRWAILSDLMRRVPMPTIRRKLQDAFDNPIMKSGGRVSLQDLRLSPQETRALGFIDGVRSLVQLAADLPQDADNFMRVAYLLKDLDMVSFAGVKVTPRAAPPPGATPPPAAAQAAVVAPPPPTVQGQPAAAAKPGAAPAQAAKPPAPGAPKPAGPPVAAPARPPSAPATAAAKPAAAPAPAAAPKDPAVELEELRKLVAKLDDQNLFEILGLKESADSAAVKVAYFKLAKLHHPDTVPQNAPPELAKLKEDFFAAVGEAYRRLGDDKSRAEYIEELKTGSGEEVDVQAILMAEELFTKGRIMVQAKKFADAVKMLDDAIKANGEEGEFYAWRGFAKFFSNPDRKEGFNEAMKDLQLCLKKNPRVAQAYYFQGVMAKLLGDNANAQKLFAKTVELQPNHVDAQRELRMNKK